MYVYPNLALRMASIRSSPAAVRLPVRRRSSWGRAPRSKWDWVPERDWPPRLCCPPPRISPGPHWEPDPRSNHSDPSIPWAAKRSPSVGRRAIDHFPFHCRASVGKKMVFPYSKAFPGERSALVELQHILTGMVGELELLNEKRESLSS